MPLRQSMDVELWLESRLGNLGPLLFAICSCGLASTGKVSLSTKLSFAAGLLISCIKPRSNSCRWQMAGAFQQSNDHYQLLGKFIHKSIGVLHKELHLSLVAVLSRASMPTLRTKQSAG